jgi:CubicO group peptidase (beta-lactamase class C family)
MTDFAGVEAVITGGLDRVFPAAQVHIRHRGQTVFARAYGYLDPETRERPAQLDTLFDLASVTKLFVVTAFMTLVEAGEVGLDQPVSTVLPEFSGERPIRPYEDPLKLGQFVEVVTESGNVDAGQITFRHLLTHTSGLPAWRPIWQQATAEIGRKMALGTHFAYRPGMRTVYSDVGLILLGMAIERLSGQGLEQAVRQRVTAPLGLGRTGYLPIVGRRALDAPEALAPSNIAPTELCRWRGRRIVGEVHDENAASLGGVAGHAGLFSTADEVALFGQSFLSAARLRPDTVAEMTRLQAQDGAVRRGLGFALWSPDPEASGNAFSQSAYGHTGFTGTSVWIDPERELIVACNTNRVYFGRDADGILAFRVALHRAIVQLLRG